MRASGTRRCRDGASTAAISAPFSAPTIGFHTYAAAAAAREQAAGALVAPPRTRLVCVPVEPLAGGAAIPY